MSAPLLYVTGTNTGVGKTTLSCLLLQRARERNIHVSAMKPFCTGGREDAEKLHALQSARLTLDELNPFHFAEPIAPYIAARNENRTITAAQTIDAIHRVQSKGTPLLIEGAGGLMSPLGDRFTLLNIINELPGKVAVVAPNMLGVLNSALLTHKALPASLSLAITFVLKSPTAPDASTRSNGSIIREWTGASTLELPFLPDPEPPAVPASICDVVDALFDWWIH